IFYLPETKGATQNQGSGLWTWLGMTTDKGSLNYFGTNPAANALKQGDRFENLILGPKPGAWHFARIVGGGAGPAQVSVRLIEQGYARDGQAYNAAPLIPWTFYYWPTCGLEANPDD